MGVYIGVTECVGFRVKSLGSVNHPSILPADDMGNLFHVVNSVLAEVLNSTRVLGYRAAY